MPVATAVSRTAAAMPRASCDQAVPVVGHQQPVAVPAQVVRYPVTVPARQGVVPISTATNTPGKLIRPADYRGIPELWITP